jgi:hypothetical protein
VHPLYIAWGICKITDEAHLADTGLVKELGRKLATPSVSGDELTVSISEVISTNQEVFEVGIFDAPTKGYMLYRGLFCHDSTIGTPIPESRHLISGDPLSISIIFDLADGTFV